MEKKVKEIVFGWNEITGMPVYILEDGSKMIPIHKDGYLIHVNEAEYQKLKAEFKKK